MAAKNQVETEYDSILNEIEILRSRTEPLRIFTDNERREVQVKEILPILPTEIERLRLRVGCLEKPKEREQLDANLTELIQSLLHAFERYRLGAEQIKLLFDQKRYIAQLNDLSPPKIEPHPHFSGTAPNTRPSDRLRLKDDFTFHQRRFFDAIQEHVPEVISDLKQSVFVEYKRRRNKFPSYGATVARYRMGGSSTEINDDLLAEYGIVRKPANDPFDPQLSILDDFPSKVWRSLLFWANRNKLLRPNENWTEALRYSNPAAKTLNKDMTSFRKTLIWIEGQTPLSIPSGLESSKMILNIENPDDVIGIAGGIRIAINTLREWYETENPSFDRWVYPLMFGRSPELGIASEIGLRFYDPFWYHPRRRNWAGMIEAIRSRSLQQVSLNFNIKVNDWNILSTTRDLAKYDILKALGPLIEEHLDSVEHIRLSAPLQKLEIKKRLEHYQLLALYQAGKTDIAGLARAKVLKLTMAQLSKHPTSKQMKLTMAQSLKHRQESDRIWKELHRTAKLVAGVNSDAWLRERKNDHLPDE